MVHEDPCRRTRTQSNQVEQSRTQSNSKTNFWFDCDCVRLCWTVVRLWFDCVRLCSENTVERSRAQSNTVEPGEHSRLWFDCVRLCSTVFWFDYRGPGYMNFYDIYSINVRIMIYIYMTFCIPNFLFACSLNSSQATIYGIY